MCVFAHHWKHGDEFKQQSRYLFLSCWLQFLDLPSVRNACMHGRKDELNIWTMPELIYGWIGMGWWVGRLDWESRTHFNFLVPTAFQFVSCTPASLEGPEKAIPSLASELRQTATTAQASSNNIWKYGTMSRTFQTFGVEPVELRNLHQLSQRTLCQSLHRLGDEKCLPNQFIQKPSADDSFVREVPGSLHPPGMVHFV